MFPKVITEQLVLNEQIEKEGIDKVIGENTGYNDILLIQRGELVYQENIKENYKNWLEELGIRPYNPTIQDFVREGKLKVGDYVNYIPDIGTYKVADGEYGTGYTTSEGYQSFTTEVNNEELGTTSLKWRIFAINERMGQIELVSDDAG